MVERLKGKRKRLEVYRKGRKKYCTLFHLLHSLSRMNKLCTKKTLNGFHIIAKARTYLDFELCRF